MDAVLGFLQVIRTMQDDAAADSRAPGRDLFKEEAVRRTVIINEDLLRIPPLEMVFQSFPQLVPQERSLGDLMEILPAVWLSSVLSVLTGIAAAKGMASLCVLPQRQKRRKTT